MVAAITNLFPLGQVVSTPGALQVLQDSGQSFLEFLERHKSGDWGIVGQEDWAANDLAITEGTRIFSAYRTRNGKKIWVITEADRSSTCLLLPEEY